MPPFEGPEGGTLLDRNCPPEFIVHVCSFVLFFVVWNVDVDSHLIYTTSYVLMGEWKECMCEFPGHK